MEDFKVKAGLKLRALSRAVEMLAGKAAPELEALSELNRAVVVEAWRVLAWASGPAGRHEAALGEGIAVATRRLEVPEAMDRRLRGTPRVSEAGPRVWAAVLDALRDGAFGGRCPVLRHEGERHPAVEMPTEVVHYPDARRGLLPHASVDGAARMATDAAPDEVRAAQARLRRVVGESLPLAVARLEAVYAPVPAFAREIERCVWASELLRAFPGTSALLAERGREAPVVDASAAALLRDLT